MIPVMPFLSHFSDTLRPTWLQVLHCGNCSRTANDRTILWEQRTSLCCWRKANDCRSLQSARSTSIWSWLNVRHRSTALCTV